MHKRLVALLFLGLGASGSYAATAVGYHESNRVWACSEAKNQASKYGTNVSKHCDCDGNEYGQWVCSADYDKESYSNSSRNSYSNQNNSNSNQNSTPRNYQYNSSPGGINSQTTLPPRRGYILGGMN